MPFATVHSARGTHRLHYEVHGPSDAPPVLLVMGMAFSSRAWDTFPRRLADRFRVISFDNRGTGRSEAPKGFFAINELADDAVAVLDALGVAQANVFGISLGGMIAQELALRHPARVRSLVLGCTFAGYLRSHKPSLTVTRHMLASSAKGGSGELARVAHVLISDGHFAKDAAGFVAWLGTVERAPPPIVMRQMFAAMRHSTERRLGRIGCPTLVITGDADRLVPPANSRALAKRIPNARLVELADVGHCFPFERPDETARAVSAHFAAEA